MHSRNLFDDFLLELEFRVVEAGTDAGLFIRATPDDQPAGYRISLSDSTSGNSAVGRVQAKGTKSSTLRFEEARLAGTARPIGEWQKMSIACEGQTLRVTLNGVQIAGGAALQPSSGVIGFEGRKGLVEVRQVQAIHQRPSAFTEDPARGLFKKKHEGLTSPKIIADAKPRYPRGAMQRRVQGVVWLEAIVLPDGSVGDARVTESLDVELDLEAIKTMKKWKFAPATLQGKPVSVIIDVEMSFTLLK
jgi:TonB family protein